MGLNLTLLEFILFITFGLVNLCSGVLVVVLFPRYSVGKEASISRGLISNDFDPKEKFWTRFPSEGSKITPPHQSAEFRWKDYCPMVFRYSLFIFGFIILSYFYPIDTIS